MLTLYGFPNSRSARIRWGLEEIGLDYDYVKVNLASPSGPGEDFLRINPGGKVPAIDDEGLVLTESAAILTYLADRYAPGTMYPAAGTRERAVATQWCFFILTELEQPLWTLAKHKFALPKERRVPEIRETAAWEFARACRAFASGLGEREVLAGDNFSFVDLLATHTLAWGRAARLPLGHDNLERYADRHLQRPAWLKVMELDAE
ncbi:MAG: glutathione S-transferase family protein [Desulfuromonas sp.]|nr:MAG: glutathione S-transferase family protein [Desulfuromonas sp.]